MIESPHAADAHPARAGLFALQRNARADGRDAARPRRARRSTCRTSARASTRSSTRWRTACAPPPATASRSSCATGPTRSAASAVEGPMLEPGFESFVGLFPIPMRHGMTIGELARALQHALRDRRGPARRGDGGLVARTCTSTRPGCPGSCRRRTCPRSTRPSSIPGAVLFEGTQLSEGRGTTRPFELLGAPWIDAERAARRPERARARRRALPAGRSSSRRSTSTRARRAAAARST